MSTAIAAAAALASGQLPEGIDLGVLTTSLTDAELAVGERQQAAAALLGLGGTRKVRRRLSWERSEAMVYIPHLNPGPFTQA